MRRAPVIAALLTLAGCGGASHDTATAPRRTTTTTTRTATLSRAERADLARRRAAERAHFAAPGITDRAALLRAVRRSILRDARARVKGHRLKGPILDVTCKIDGDDRPLVAAHPDAPVVRYTCLAVTFRARTSPPTELGTPFVARVDFARGRYAWCEFTPVGGEGAHTATTFSVPPPAACIAPPPR